MSRSAYHEPGWKGGITPTLCLAMLTAGRLQLDARVRHGFDDVDSVTPCTYSPTFMILLFAASVV